MKRGNLSLSILLFTVITLNSYAGISVCKIPRNVLLSVHKYTGDYIWYQLYGENYGSKIARIHVPSRTSQVFDLNGLSNKKLFSNVEAPDSNHCVVFNVVGDLAFFNGTTWTYLNNRSIRCLGSTKQGTIFMASNDYFGYILKDSILLIPRDSIGLSDNPIIAVAGDTANIYVMNKHKVAKYDGLTWTVIFHDDSVMLDWIGMFPDNSVYFHWLDLTVDYFCKMTPTGTVKYTFDEADSIQRQFSKLPTDASGNIWNTRFGDGEFHLEMINGNDTTNISNALARGWKNWPELMSTDSRLCTTSGKHVYFMIDNGFYHYDGGPGRTWEWIPLCQTFDALDTIGASTLVQSADSSIYIYGRNGLHRYKNGKFYTFPGFGIYSICVDREGVLWAAVDDYLCRYEEPFYKKVVLMPGIRQIIEDKAGRIVVLTNGPQIFRESGTEWELINKNSSNLPDSATVVKILQASDGAYWLCTFRKGVAKSMDLHNWITFDTSNSIFPSNIANDMVLDLEGNVIVSFLDNDRKSVGILKYAGNKWINLGVPATPKISNLNVDRYGKIWYGMAWYDGTTWNIVDDSLTLNTFIVDYSGTLWAATDDKIYLTTNDEFYKFNAQAAGTVKPGVKNNKYSTVSVRCTPGIATTINYTIDKSVNVTIAIYSLQGKLVTTLKKGYLNSGSYSAVWNNGGARGLYVLRFSSPGLTYNVPIKNL